MMILSGWWYTYPLKNMSSSVGMMISIIYGKMFQTTNQIVYNFPLTHLKTTWLSMNVNLG